MVNLLLVEKNQHVKGTGSFFQQLGNSELGFMEKKIMSQDAAVVVLYEQATDSLVLTRRSTQLRDHPGEICFPGGRWEKGDQTLSDTALRELQEELGIESERVLLQKMMKPQKTLSGYLIHPWFASIDTLTPYQINSGEVDSVLQLPMTEVCLRSNYKQIIVQRRGLKITTYQYLKDNSFVWGATAQIMMQLCE